MNEKIMTPVARGPSEHIVRDQVVAAATKYFGYFGYEKTTVSDLAKAIGFSKAYIYKFFDSKQAIGEQICSNCLMSIMDIVNAAVTNSPTASEKIRQLFSALTQSGSDLFFHDRKLYNIAAVDKKTGKLKIDAGFLVGFLKVIIDSNPAIDGNGAKYKALGDSLIAQSQTKKKDKDPD